ncbi:GNAT family N-acetyltransferase [Devosia sp.]|uniref:GNAT family N-acetyltransferase n=1 Tax=Devosia sp. TaxID=1871048 RepID=UPI003A956BF4
MTTIRPAGRADIAALLDLDPIARTERARRDAIARWAAAGQCHVALRDGEVAGYVVFTHGFFGQPFVELLMVRDNARRAGVGAALTNHCVERAGEAPKLWCTTNTSNAAMQGLLAKLGFIRSGQIDNLDDSDPELVFLRRSD